jgi:hypothetical protein
MHVKAYKNYFVVCFLQIVKHLTFSYFITVVLNN